MKPDLSTAERFDSLFQYYARPPIDWRWLRAQAKAESGSGIDPRAVSAAGAQGEENRPSTNASSDLAIAGRCSH